MSRKPTAPKDLTVTKWFTASWAGQATGRHPVLIRRWARNGTIPAVHVARGAEWPYPILISKEGLGYIVTQRERPDRRGLPPGALRPAPLANGSSLPATEGTAKEG